ncbi:hypothetical protein E2493_00100 [Sphingomonas parva]|uniref:Sulfatase N-terminal domain-containing protein n=1 Tax=Sphingomonas parva TaxID=2555898 RepID=A0A4Y8ZZD8_9SPHN|nr:sulfatase-like hydrolase/transferase [Sphingomonas parva]TFI60156.1 hypothetical protein E2493_00100 [Sphingomonas parva]
MDVALDVGTWDRQPNSVRSLLNWLLCWIVLPNLSFCLIWIVGGPPRSWPVIVTAVVGILLHRAPFPLKFAGFLGALTYSVLQYISGIFNLSIASLAFSLKFAAELSPSASPEYVAALFALAGTLVGAFFALRRSTVLAKPTWIVGVACLAYTFGAFDVYMAQGKRGTYKRVPEAGAPFDSAAHETGLLQLADGRRHVLVVIVESFGLPVDAPLRNKLLSTFVRPELRGRYDVTTGDTLFYGSTTNGEVREMCGRWGDYPALMNAKDSGCLPAQLAAKGYETQAWHSFEGYMFDRTAWYPNIGFQQSHFATEIRRGGAKPCPGVFAGVCDRDVPAQIARTLKFAKQPQFAYWLTVNSHLPVVESTQLETDNCVRYDPELNRDFPMICRQLAIFDEIGKALSRQITAPDFPPTDILIVGDHIPPFFDRHHREQFAGDRVPWILLKARAPAAGAGPPHA